MIIGNKNNENILKKQPKFTSNFEERFNKIVEENSKSNENISSFNESSQTTKYFDVNNKNEMADKSFAMLQERYNNGLISLDEFTRKCNQLSKIRQK